MSFNIKTIGTDGIVGNHPDVTSWLNTIALVGGSASSSTITALNNFCNSIDSAGLRNKFYRLNLFCGNNLNACLVPLYVNTAWNLPVLGFSIDTNNNFVNNDYSESGITGGLIGNGTNKYLNTGFIVNSLLSGDRHLAIYHRTRSTNSFDVDIGAEGPASLQQSFSLGTGSSATAYGFRFSNNTDFIFPTAAYTETGAFWIGSHNASGLPLGTIYKNGIEASPYTLNGSNNGVGGTTNISSIFIFALNRAGSTADFSSARITCYSIGLSMTSSQALTYNNIMQTFQTSLGRNV